MRAGKGNTARNACSRRTLRSRPASSSCTGTTTSSTGDPGGPGTGMGARVSAGATGLGRGRWGSLAAAVDMPRSVRAGPQTGVGSACASAGSSGARGNTTRKVAPRPGAEFDLGPAPVRLGDGRHDRQPQAAAAAGARPRRIGAEEALEHPLGVVRREARAAVGHLHHGLLALRRARARSRGRPAACGPARCSSRLPTTWRRRTSSPSTTTGPALVEVDRPVRLDHAGVGDQVRARGPPGRCGRRSSGRPWSSRASSSRSSTSTPMRVGLLLDPAHGRLEVGRAAPRRRGGRARRSPRTEVSGVWSSWEASPTNWRSRALGLAPLGEGLLDAAEHHVERAARGARSRCAGSRPRRAARGRRPRWRRPSRRCARGGAAPGAPATHASRRRAPPAWRRPRPARSSRSRPSVSLTSLSGTPITSEPSGGQHARGQARLPAASRSTRTARGTRPRRRRRRRRSSPSGIVRRHAPAPASTRSRSWKPPTTAPAAVADLHDDAGRQRRGRNAASGPRQVGRVGLDGQARGRQAGVGQLVVHPVDQEAAQGLVGGPPGGRQGHGHHRQRDQQQAGAQRHGRGYLWRRRSE